jgi:hypothetical protein
VPRLDDAAGPAAVSFMVAYQDGRRQHGPAMPVTDALADRTPDADDPRPWEEPGAVRRDCPPHRGLLLMLLGASTLAIGLTSVCLVYTGLAALPLAIVVELLIRRDQGRMAKGRMDRRGWSQAERARQLAWGGALAGFMGGLFCGEPLWEMVSRFVR